MSDIVITDRRQLGALEKFEKMAQYLERGMDVGKARARARVPDSTWTRWRTKLHYVTYADGKLHIHVRREDQEQTSHLPAAAAPTNGQTTLPQKHLRQVTQTLLMQNQELMGLIGMLIGSENHE